ncbi:MAG: porin [Elusimicrobia bacterium]|nr:porin [Elusimicrobiota bacterium]MBK8651806.1 porin [Elusimicrobiota bacterium]
MKRNNRINRTALSLAIAALGLGAARAEGPTISGSVDLGYSYNFNGLDASAYRAFDANANSINLQYAEMVVTGKTASDVGYRVDVGYGNDAGVVSFFDGSGNDQINLQQAFLTFTCPITKGTITAGKFVTPFGAEVIEAKDNYNISRGLLFTNAIPLVHTGAKLDKGFMDGKYNVTAGVVNGWDVSADNNKGKTFLAQAAINTLPKISVIVGGAYGPEVASPEFTTPGTGSTEKFSRGLVDAIVKYTPTDKLTLLANADWGVEEGAAFEPTASDDTTANWAGVALYANYLFSDTLSGTLRYENFDDEGSRLTGGTTHQSLNSYTATLQYKMKDVTYRLEFRQDQSSDKVFTDADGAADDVQSTLGAQVLFAF